MTETHQDTTVPASLGTLIDVVLDDDQAAGGKTRPPVLLAAALACALVAALLAGNVGVTQADAAAPEAAASR